MCISNLKIHTNLDSDLVDFTLVTVPQLLSKQNLLHPHLEKPVLRALSATNR